MMTTNITRIFPNLFLFDFYIFLCFTRICLSVFPAGSRQDGFLFRLIPGHGEGFLLRRWNLAFPSTHRRVPRLFLLFTPQFTLDGAIHIYFSPEGNYALDIHLYSIETFTSMIFSLFYTRGCLTKIANLDEQIIHMRTCNTSGIFLVRTIDKPRTRGNEIIARWMRPG